VSVVIPAYNAAATIGDAVESVLRQSFGDFELLVINDGSTDSTAAVARSFADPRVRVIDAAANAGISAAFNLGVSLARADLVARLDADDIAEPDRLAEQTAFLRAHPEVTVCGTDMRRFGGGDGLTDAPETDDDIKAMFLAARNNIMNPTAMVRRPFLIDHVIKAHPGYASCQDLAFWIDCMRAGARFANIKRPLVRYRIHERNISGTTSPTALRTMNVDIPRIRTELAGELFPHLTRDEVVSMLRIFHGGELSVEQAFETVAACGKALATGRSVYGENRALLGRIVETQLARFAESVRSATGVALLPVAGAVGDRR